MTRLSTLNLPRLYQALDHVRRSRGMTWGEVAGQTGLSPSTLSRLTQGHRPDVDGSLSLAAWLNLPLETFTDRAPWPRRPVPDPDRLDPAKCAQIQGAIVLGIQCNEPCPQCHNEPREGLGWLCYLPKS